MIYNKEELSIPFNIEDAVQLFQVSADFDNKNPNFYVKEMIQCLEAGIRQNQPQKILKVYKQYIPGLQRQFFRDTPWPSPQQIQDIFQIQIDLSTQSIYNEVIYRHLELQEKNTNKEQKIWDNYVLIFEDEKDAVLKLTNQWIWDIVSYFIRGYYQFRNKKQSWKLQAVRHILKQNANLTQHTSLKLFSIIGLLQLHIQQQEFEEGIKLFSIINYNDLKILSKAYTSLQSLFLSSSLCYFMVNQYLFANILLENILWFYIENNRLIKKSSNYSSELNSRLVALYCLNHLFYPSQVESSFQQLIGQTSINNEPLSNIFSDIIQGCNKSLEKLLSFLRLQNQNPIISKQEEIECPTIYTIISFYKTISINTATSILNVNQQQLFSQLERYKNMFVVKENDSQFEKDVVKRFLSSSFFNYKVEGSIVTLECNEDKLAQKGLSYEQNAKKIDQKIKEYIRS